LTVTLRFNIAVLLRAVLLYHTLSSHRTTWTYRGGSPTAVQA